MRRIGLLLSTMALAVLLASGVALAINTIQCKTISFESGNGTCYGTPKRDLMRGTDGHNDMYALASADTLKGFGGPDNLYGQGGSDVLVGGNGKDGMYGGIEGDDDTLKGGAGEDSYEQCARWGNDEVVDTAEAARGDSLFNGNSFSVFYQCAIRGEGMVVNLNSGPGPEATQGTDTVDWTDNAIADVFISNDGGNDDRVVGNDAANFIVAGDGLGRQRGGEVKRVDSDTVLGGGGDDRLNVQDASGDDTVECGGGNDTVLFDPGDTLLDPTACEQQDDSPPPFEGLP
jgi:Ca2+-binding RTX toxin-like protein